MRMRLREGVLELLGLQVAHAQEEDATPHEYDAHEHAHEARWTLCARAP